MGRRHTATEPSSKAGPPSSHCCHLLLLSCAQVVAKKQAAAQAQGLTCPPHYACLLDTKGPEIRTAMLKEGKDIELVAGQPIFIEAVGDAYTTWEGFKDPVTGETRIGLSYDKLCSSVQAGNKILLADGSISITVNEVLSATTLRGTVMNTKKLGQRKNGNLPGTACAQTRCISRCMQGAVAAERRLQSPHRTHVQPMYGRAGSSCCEMCNMVL